MAEPLRLGVVGTETGHAIYFTELLQGPTIPRDQQIPGARVIALWSRGETAEEEDRVADLREKFGVQMQVDRPEDLIGRVDAVLITTPAAEEHRSLAEPFLMARVPLFVVKPLAHTAEDARALIALAEKAGSALCSHSALRYTPRVAALAAAIPQIGPVRSAICTSPGELSTHGVHITEMFHAILGPGVESVQSVQDEEKDVAMVRYLDGKKVFLYLTRFETQTFECSYFAAKQTGHIIVTLPQPRCLIYREMFQVVLRMFRTSQHPLPLLHTLEVIAVLEAMRRSSQEKTPIYLRDILGQEPGDMTNGR